MFVSIPPSILSSAATAESLNPAQAAAIFASVPPPQWQAFVEFGKAGIKSQADWEAEFPLMAQASDPQVRFVIRVVMQGLGGVVVDTGA